MKDLIQNVRDLKTEAKNHRDMEDYGSAISCLYEAISLLQTEFSSASALDWKSQLACEFADCYGIMGGVHRRWGVESEDTKVRAEHFVESVTAYDEGHKFESAPKYGIVGSYNLVNRLVSRIFLEQEVQSVAASTAKTSEFDPLDVMELEAAERIIREQLKVVRRGDIWALADLALVTMLLGREKAAIAYADFQAKSPPEYAFESALSTLEELAKLNLPVSENLGEAVLLLKRDLERLRR